MSIEGIPALRIGNMFYRRVGVSTELWTCKHDIAYPDVCPDCLESRCLVTVDT